MRVRIDHPRPGEPARVAGKLAFVAGRAWAPRGGAESFDVMLAVDISEGTLATSGIDVNGDGEVAPSPGWRRAKVASPDSVLAAELAGLEGLLDVLHPDTARVGLLTFGAQADRVLPPTRKHERVRAAFSGILKLGGRGSRNLGDGLLAAARALPEAPGDAVRSIVVLVTLAQPPECEGRECEPAAWLQRAGRIAAQRGVRVHAYAIGRDTGALAALEQVARDTGGALHVVPRPDALAESFHSARFGDVAAVEVTNRSTGEPARAIVLDPDGSFAALVPLSEGSADVEVRARGAQGGTGSASVELTRRDDAPQPELDLRLRRLRVRVLREQVSQTRPVLQ